MVKLKNLRWPSLRREQIRAGRSVALWVAAFTAFSIAGGIVHIAIGFAVAGIGFLALDWRCGE